MVVPGGNVFLGFNDAATQKLLPLEHDPIDLRPVQKSDQFKE